MRTEQHIDWFRDILTNRGYAPGTARNYVASLRLWLALDDPANDSQRFLDDLSAGGLAPGSIRNVWAAVSCFLSVGGLIRLGIDQIPPVQLPVARNRPTRGALSRAELHAVLSALPLRGRSFTRQRSRTMFVLLYSTGLRLGEAMGLWITTQKGRSATSGFLLGLLLGPVGVLIALLLPADEAGKAREALRTGRQKQCRACLSVIPIEATACRFCGRDA